MAKTKYQPARPELTAGELSIKLYPRSNDCWRGTAAQLLGAGLLPDGFQWPERTDRKSFTHAGIECSVQRRRPEGSGRSGTWVSVDHWELFRFCKDRGKGGPGLYETEQALQYARWIRSPEGDRMFNRLMIARDDSRFQAFLPRALGFGREASQHG